MAHLLWHNMKDCNIREVKGGVHAWNAACLKGPGLFFPCVDLRNKKAGAEGQVVPKYGGQEHVL